MEEKGNLLEGLKITEASQIKPKKTRDGLNRSSYRRPTSFVYTLIVLKFEGMHGYLNTFKYL